MARFFPRSLQGQMLLAVALALLVAQGISAHLLYSAGEQRREMATVNALAFQLVAEPRIDYRDAEVPRAGAPALGSKWRRVRIERSARSPLGPGDDRSTQRETHLREVLADQGVSVADLVVLQRDVADDPYIQASLRGRPGRNAIEAWRDGQVIVAGLRRAGEDNWSIARIPQSSREPRALGSLILQTLLLYVVLVGGLALLLRRITRPLAALTRRVEAFAETRATEGQIAPTGPDDMRLLIVAHNAMEARIAALLAEKDVMLGAIGHDLKTPLAALRVRIETVEDTQQRERMAESIEGLARTLDDILSLARAGRSTDPLERTDLSALVASVVEDYEDMGEPVELLANERLALPLRATWMRRALHNLVGNALRYGGRARVTLAREGNSAVLRIEDDGPGMPEGEMAEMMQPFTRGEASRNRATGGAGLGLALARTIAEQHRGTLHLANRIDSSGKVLGLVAELRLPLD